jgi:large subunit ribosomal protein L25
MAESLTVEKRPNHGKHHAKRLRNTGAIPAVLYGHGLEPVSLSVPRDAFIAALRHGARLVELQGAVHESALIRDLQWDTYGTAVLHIDFARVAADERFKVTVPVEVRGQAAGVRAGGVIQHLVHEIEIECLASAIPEKLQVNVNHLELNGTILVGQIELPAGVTLLSEADAVAVQCIEPAVEEEAVEGVAGEAAEPEVIGRKAEAEEEEAKE